MSTTAVAPSPAGVTTPPPVSPTGPPITIADIRRFTVEQYHKMIEAGILGPDDRLELLDGYLVKKMPKNSPHAVANELVREALTTALPAGWVVRVQNPIRLDDAEPEPDVAVARGATRDYLNRHPVPADIALVVEVADSSVDRDRGWKKAIYARNAIPWYWIVNLVDGAVQVFSDPSGPTPSPDYATARTLTPADRVDVVIAGATAGTVAVADLLP